MLMLLPSFRTDNFPVKSNLFVMFAVWSALIGYNMVWNPRLTSGCAAHYGPMGRLANELPSIKSACFGGECSREWVVES